MPGATICKANLKMQNPENFCLVHTNKKTEHQMSCC